MSRLVFALGVLAGTLALTAGGPAPQRVTSDYAGSETCRRCHSGIYESYRKVSMAGTFQPIAEAEPVEDWTNNNRFDHAASGDRFQMIRRGGRFFQRRFRLDDSGNEVRVFEREIHFAIGSGHNERDYVHLSESGRMTQLPVVWYTQEQRWGMAPGYDRADHDGFSRLVNYRCTFCHMGYPNVSERDARYEAQHSRYPSELPRGIDCERCHGPGTEHVRSAENREDLSLVRGHIVNPARLGRKLEMDVCMQCHLETTSVSLPNAIIKIGRGVFSFRPGEALEEYAAYFDFPEGSEHDDDFNIVHQAYRLRKSACFLKSDMTCTTCHDPHRVPEDRNAQRRSACAQCHEQFQCTETGARRDAVSNDCATCHMPRRRTDDVVHVVMTDHHIQRRPKPGLPAPIEEKHGAPYRGPLRGYLGEPERSIHTAMALVQGAGVAEGVARLEEFRGASGLRSPEAMFALATGYEALGNPDEALKAYEETLRLDPAYVEARYNMGLVLMRVGNRDAAGQAFQTVVEQSPEMADAHSALALIAIQDGHYEVARMHYLAAVRIDDLNTVALNGLGLVERSLNRPRQAREYFERALAIEPENRMAAEQLRSLPE